MPTRERPGDTIHVDSHLPERICPSRVNNPLAGGYAFGLMRLGYRTSEMGAEQPLKLPVDTVLPPSYPAVEVRAIRIQACHASYQEEEQPQWMLKPTTP